MLYFNFFFNIIFGRFRTIPEVDLKIWCLLALGEDLETQRGSRLGAVNFVACSRVLWGVLHCG